MYPPWLPFYSEDRDVDDCLAYDEQGPIRFNPELESSAQHILKIRDRGGVFHLALPSSNVTNMLAQDEGVFLSSVPREEDVWEPVRLPVADVGTAFRLGVDIVRKCNRGRVRYDDHF